VADVVQRLKTALEADYVVLGGGNARKLKELPPDCRLGDNANAFIGGFRLWEGTGLSAAPVTAGGNAEAKRPGASGRRPSSTQRDGGEK
jgi:polyphosphate glucokinase